MNLAEWTYAVKFVGSKKSKNQITKIIKEECLMSKDKVYGIYLIDGNKVWNKLIKDDPDCQSVIEDKKIHDVLSLESKVEEMKYRAFWSNNRRAYRKKRR